MSTTPVQFLVADPSVGIYIHTHSPDSGSTLNAVQDLAEGWIEEVPINVPGVLAWANEEGLTYRMPFNIVGSILLNTHGHAHQPFVGPIVFTGPEVDGEFTGVNNEQVGEMLVPLLGAGTEITIPCRHHHQAAPCPDCLTVTTPSAAHLV